MRGIFRAKDASASFRIHKTIRLEVKKNFAKKGFRTETEAVNYVLAEAFAPSLIKEFDKFKAKKNPLAK